MLNLDRAETMLARLPVRDRYTRRLIPFNLKWSQQQMLEAAKKQWRRGKPIRIIILKARRVGGSSFTEGLGLLHGMAEETSLGLIVAHQFKSSQGLFEVPLNLISRALPNRESLKKLCGITNTKHEIIIPHRHNETTIKLATAGSVSGAGGRGLSFTFLHLSECAYFPGIQPFTSLLPTVPYDPNTIVVLESTANGRVGPGASFYDYWQKANEGVNDYIPVFIPWHKDPSYIRPEEGGKPPYDEYEEELVKRFGCDERQIAWWRSTLETECKGTLSIMQQEYPASAEEAFIATGDPSFESAELDYCRNLVCDPLAVGDIVCDIDSRIANWQEYASGDWAVWRFPEPGHKYFIGVDAARGMQLEDGDIEPSSEGDFAAAAVWDANTNEMVARYAKRDSPEILARKMHAAGHYYNKAMINIEITGGLGIWAQKVLRDPPYSYSHLYRWRGSKDDRIGQSNQYHRKITVGWETTMYSRQMIFDAFRAGIRQGVIKIYDRGLLTQMENAQNKEGFRWEVIRGHDDILMSALVGWIAREHWGPSYLRGGTIAGGKAPADVEGPIPTRSPGYVEGMAIIDDAAYQLSDHYYKVKRVIANSGKPDPLIGI